MFSVVDIETTGGSFYSGKITEIAIFVHNGKKVVKSFSSLINPEMPIPPYISRMTRITDEMVADAPKFYEIAKKVIEITEENIFVAHNVGFDYGFIKEEFRKLGYCFNRSRLCTIQLSRRFIPGKKSYGLGNLCYDLKININNRHRATGDAAATVKVLEILLKLEPSLAKNGLVNDDYKFLKYNIHLTREDVDSIPEATGVYYFYNTKNQLIYVGKSINIRHRILTHLNNCNGKKAVNMRGEIAQIGYELTGSELIALLLESDEIKKYQPCFNRVQRCSIYRYGILAEKDENGYLHLKIIKIKETNTSLLAYTQLKKAQKHLFALVARYGLCQKLCGLYPSDSHCFQYLVNTCAGACIGKEKPESYNKKVQKLIDQANYHHKSMFIIDVGRSAEEYAVVHIEKGHYKGFGFIDKYAANNSIEMLQSAVKNYPENGDIHRIIHDFLRKKVKNIQMIYYDSEDLSKV